MKILWVSNSPIGPAAEILGAKYDGTSGGWIQSEFEKINKEGNSFFFLCTNRKVKKNQVVSKTSDLGTAYCIHSPKLCYGIKTPSYLRNIIERVINEIKPDVIHIWGTETFLSNAVANSSYRCLKIVFLQGLLGIHKHYLGGYFNKKIYKQFYVKKNVKDFFKDCIRNRYFRKQSLIERDTILKCKNVIIDGYLSRSYCMSISENINIIEYKLLPSNVFHSCCWDYNKCEKHSIFTIYSGSFEKGLQQLLMSIAIVKKVYQDVKVYVPGSYSFDNNGKLKPSTFFEKVIKKMIEKLGIDENIVFTGKLNSKEMLDYMKKANCFINTSIMEVHALSLREALIVGTPSITSLCGNVLDYVRHNENGFIYRFEEVETLAYYIERVFSMDIFATNKNEYLINNNNLFDVYTKCKLERIK